MEKQPLIILSGPTAVGKTATSINLAKKINGEIISADSMQVYKGMNIGTAKITKEEMDGVKHHLIDILDPSMEFNVMMFAKMAKEYITDICSRGKTPIIVGGTGFYIQAVLYDIDFENEENDYSYRKELENIAREKGPEYLYDMLKAVDPDACSYIHMNNTKRVIRALEFYKLTNKPISKHNEEQKQKEANYNYGYFVLTDDRDALYQRINNRVDKMISDGLLDEVTNLKNQGFNKNLVSMQGIGYKEIYEYLDGLIDLNLAIDKIKLNTRHFAKRQLTWFKREKDINMIDISQYNYDFNSVASYIVDEIKKKGIVK